MIAFNPDTAELFYLCMFLYCVPGPTSFRDLWKVGDVMMDTYLAACIAHEIVVTFGPALREVFANMLMFILRGEHLQFWERHKRVLGEDFMHRAAVNEPDEYILNQVLLDLKVVGQEKLSYYATSSTKSVQKAKWLLQQLRVALQLLYCQKAPPFTAEKNVLSFSLMNPPAVWVNMTALQHSIGWHTSWLWMQSWWWIAMH